MGRSFDPIDIIFITLITIYLIALSCLIYIFGKKYKHTSYNEQKMEFKKTSNPKVILKKEKKKISIISKLKNLFYKEKKNTRKKENANVQIFIRKPGIKKKKKKKKKLNYKKKK